MSDITKRSIIRECIVNSEYHDILIKIYFDYCDSYLLKNGLTQTIKIVKEWHIETAIYHNKAELLQLFDNYLSTIKNGYDGYFDFVYTFKNFEMLCKNNIEHAKKYLQEQTLQK